MAKSTLKRILAAAGRAVLSGEQDHISKALTISAQSKQKAIRRYRKHLDASEDWQRYGTTVYNAHGIAFDGIAYWYKRVCVRLNGHDYRFQVLCLARFECLTFYLIPIGHKGKQLPDIDLGEGEFQMLIEMADDIGDSSAKREYMVELKNPLRWNTEDRIASWKVESYDQSGLLELLESQPILLHVLTAALDAQLRALKDLRDAPATIYNFLLPKGNHAPTDWLISALRSVTFSNESSDLPGPIVVRSFKDWSQCFRRLTVLAVGQREVLQPILGQLETRDRLLKCGEPTISPLTTLPLVLSKNALCNPFGEDIELHQSMKPLTAYQQDLLRTAMSMALSRETAKQVFQMWQMQMERPTAYRLSGRKVWQEALTSFMLIQMFPDKSLQRQAHALQQDSQLLLEAENQKRNDCLHRAYDLVTDPEYYADRIIDRPSTKKEAEDKLSDEAFAFRYDPQKGDHSGEHFLAFSKDSLLRLLGTIGFDDRLYDAFLELSINQDARISRDAPITLGGKTFHAITFPC